MSEDVLELDEVMAGCHINQVTKKAIELADASSKRVHFEFNGTNVLVDPGEKVSEVVARWDRDREVAHQAWITSDEYKKQQERLEAEEKAANQAHHLETAKTEAEMRAAKVPWVRTQEQLTEYIESLVNRSHDYGTCCYALSMAAEAAFNYVSHKLGVTCFQCSIADMDFIRRTRHMEGPFMLIKGEDALYPQYNLFDRLTETMQKWEPWLKEEAQKNLAKTDHAHPDVIAHWKRIAEK